jgi:2-oxoglutarate ferredoxin oxidoreductase subunit beta
MNKRSDVPNRYLRDETYMPHVWCAGCGVGILQGAIVRAIDALSIHRDEVSMISGIGCLSRMPLYVDFYTLHTTHGRPIAFATGVKLARPDMHVVVVTGDGDCTAIGGNHFIHACRRNLDFTIVISNNEVYGMTGGQLSPTTPHGRRATTAPMGNAEHPFDISALAIAAGATYVARTTTYHAGMLKSVIEGGIRHCGLSVIEVLVQCPTFTGRQARIGDAVAMLDDYKKRAVPIKAWDKLPAEKREGKFSVGVLHESHKPEFCDGYASLIEKAHGEGTFWEHVLESRYFAGAPQEGHPLHHEEES